MNEFSNVQGIEIVKIENEVIIFNFCIIVKKSYYNSEFRISISATRNMNLTEWIIKLSF